MPELPEVETARSLIDAAALHRTIVDVDDRDEWVCRPHRPGEIRAALLGRSLTTANRRGKSMWCETSARIGPSGASDRQHTLEPSVNETASAGPDLGIHLGMGGIIVVTGPDGSVRRGGDRDRPGPGPAKALWDRFTLVFDDGGSLVLFDKRRLGRVRLDPDIAALGPDGLDVTPAQFRRLLGAGTAPVKARLLDQSAIAGVGNLLADQALWQAKLHPARRVNTLARPEVDRLHRALQRALASAIQGGGVHTGRVIGARVRGGACPRCGAPMAQGVVGGRTTWWCSREQAA